MKSNSKCCENKNNKFKVLDQVCKKKITKP